MITKGVARTRSGRTINVAPPKAATTATAISRALRRRTFGAEVARDAESSFDPVPPDIATSSWTELEAALFDGVEDGSGGPRVAAGVGIEDVHFFPPPGD